MAISPNYSTNRMRSAAEINASGEIVPGVAVAGYSAPDSNSINVGGTYLLEDESGDWEIGVFGAYGDSGMTRTSNESSAGSFANSTTGLTLSFIVTDTMVWAGARTGTGRKPPVAVGENSLAAGLEAYATGESSVAIGFLSNAVYPAERVLGSTYLQSTHALSVGKTLFAAAGPLPLINDDGATGAVTLNFATWHSGITNYGYDSMYRVRGTVLILDYSGTNVQANSKVIDVDYSMWWTAFGSTIALIGTAALTAIYTGGSAPNSTLSVNATTGALEITTTNGTGVKVEAELQVTRMRSL